MMKQLMPSLPFVVPLRRPQGHDSSPTPMPTLKTSPTPRPGRQPPAPQHREAAVSAGAGAPPSDGAMASSSVSVPVSLASSAAPPRGAITAVEIIAPRRATREAVALEIGMAALAHALDQPIALELAGTPDSRAFIARARDADTLGHLVRQLRARYPQAVVRDLKPETDPLRIEPGEALSALELRPGTGSHLPLRTPGPRDLAQEGADPLLGLIAAFDGLPEGHRAIAQLALLPAPDAWSASHQRLAVEHPLEPERARERWELASSRADIATAGAELGLPAVVGLLVLLGVALVTWRNADHVPLWLRQDVVALVRGQHLHLTSIQAMWLIAWGVGGVLSLITALVVIARLRARLRALFNRLPLYDQQLVQEKITRVAYHARLRVLVIGPKDPADPADPADREAAGVPEALAPAPASVPATADGREECRGPEPSRSVSARPARRRWLPRRLVHGLVRAARGGPQPQIPDRDYTGGLSAALPPTPRRHLRLGRVGRRVVRYYRLWQRRRAQARRTAQRRCRGVQATAGLRHRTLNGFISAYRQFHLATGGYFSPRWLSTREASRLVRRPRLRWGCRSPWDRRGEGRCDEDTQQDDGWSRGLRRSPHLLSIAEIAALWHLPQADDLADLPFVERTRARTLLVPAALAQAQPPPNGGLFRLGTSTHAGHTLPVFLPADATRRNALAIAKTGKGKSTLLLGLARAALAQEGSGLVLIDPHGDLVDLVLGHVPDSRGEEVLLVDLGDRMRPVGLNLLDVTLFPDRDKAVSNMIAVFRQIWKDFWGPRMESAIEAALKTLYEVNQGVVADDPQDGPDRQYTLLDATPLLTFSAFRHSLMAHIHDAALTEYWLRFEALQPRLQQDIITPVTTKLDKFANSFIARRIVGQGRSTLNMTEAVQRGQIVLVNTACGVVGHDTAALIGATLLGLLHVTLAEQAHLPPAARRQVRVLVDEFQVLQGVDFGAMLAELRKFGASFALATQALAHLDALDRTLRPTVMANVDQLFCFAMSADDGRLLERELDGVVDCTDLINLDDYSCYARLTVQGQRVPVFSLTLDPPARLDTAHRERAEALRRRSQRRVGRAVSAVDGRIAHAAVRRKAVAAQQQYVQRPARRPAHQDERPERGDTGHGPQRQNSSPSASMRSTGLQVIAPRTGDGAGADESDASAKRSDDPALSAPPLSASGGRQTRGGTRSHWRRAMQGKPRPQGKRPPNRPAFHSLIFSPATAAGRGDLDETDESPEGDEDEVVGETPS